MMAEKSTFVKLDRNILKWRWYNDLVTFKVFVHLLLTANIADKRWRDINVERGQLVISVNHLCQQTNLTVQQVRTALKHLNSTNEITIKTTNKYTVITIKNYNLYQGITNKSTFKQQTANKQLTNEQQQLKNKKEIKNKKEVKNSRVKIPDGFSSAAEFERHVAELRR